MPVDYNLEIIPNFRDLTQTGLLLLRRPVVRSLARLRRLRAGASINEAALARPAKTFVGVR